MDRLLTTALLICPCSTVAVADVATIGWSDLIEGRAQNFEDPYADLTGGQA